MDVGYEEEFNDAFMREVDAVLHSHARDNSKAAARGGTTSDVFTQHAATPLPQPSCSDWTPARRSLTSEVCHLECDGNTEDAAPVRIAHGPHVLYRWKVDSMSVREDGPAAVTGSTEEIIGKVQQSL